MSSESRLQWGPPSPVPGMILACQILACQAHRVALQRECITLSLIAAASRSNGKNRTMRKRSGAFAALLAVGLFAGTAAAQEIQTLKIACVLDAQHPMMVAGRRM